MSDDNFYASDSSNDSHNPFAAPAEIGTVARDGAMELASRWARLGGAFIDGLTMIPAILGIVALAIGIVTEGGVTDPIVGQLIGSVVGLIGGAAWYLILNGYLLSNRGQTIGKLCVGTKIVDSDTEQIVPLWPLFFKRYFSLQLIGLIPLVGGLVGLVNILLIFRDNKKCLHDDFANTKVVVANS